MIEQIIAVAKVVADFGDLPLITLVSSRAVVSKRLRASKFMI